MKTRDALLGGLTSGALLCWTHGYWSILGFVAVLPLLWALKRASSRQAFYTGLLCGIFESVVLVGTLHYSFTVFIGLALSYGLQRTLFCLVVVAGRKIESTVLRTLFAPAVWVLLELGHSRVPATLPNLLGDTQHDSILLPLAYVGGTYLISFVLVWASSCIAELIEVQRSSLRGILVGLPLGCWLLVVPTGVLGAQLLMQRGGDELIKSAVIVQGGYPRWLNEVARSSADWKDVPARVYSSLSARAPKSDIMVWPEAPVWRRWGEDSEFESMVLEVAGRQKLFLAGVIRRDEGGTNFNSALFYERGTLDFKDKQRLVLEEELGFGKGNEPALFESSLGGIGAMFCLESVVPSYARVLVQKGALAIAALANGADLGRTSVGRLHAQRSTIRAVETGRWVLHAGHHGYSRIISPLGKTKEPGSVFSSLIVFDKFGVRTSLTPYVRWGNVPLGFVCAFVVGWIGILVFYRQCVVGFLTKTKAPPSK